MYAGVTVQYVSTGEHLHEGPENFEVTNPISYSVTRTADHQQGGTGSTCMITCTSFELPGSTTPELGRTQYFFGDVVLTLNATFSWPGLVSVRVTGIVFRSSKRNFSSLGDI
jgi:hypothetical protein